MKKFRQFYLNEVMDTLPGTQYGSNPGGIHVDSAGQKHYIKQYSNPDQAKVEALSGKLYGMMGVKTANPEYAGSGRVTTPWNENLKRMEPRDFERLNPTQQHQIGRMYHAATLTKNWDIVGLEHDNIMHNTATGDLHAIDHGGAFHFRARGGPKDFGSDIGEHKTLRNNDGASGHVFSTVFKQNPNVERESLEGVRQLHPDRVHQAFRDSGLKNWQDLHQNFEARRQKLLGHYGE